MRTQRLAVALCGLLAGFGLTTAHAADVAEQVATECGACHQLSGTADSLQARAERKAPALSYAGNKFQEAWLVSWLQSPSRIRPAGDFPLTHAKTGPEGDVIDEAARLLEQMLVSALHPAILSGFSAEYARWAAAAELSRGLVGADQPGFRDHMG